MSTGPTIAGVIERRILVNYRVDPDALAAILPSPFRPRLVKGVGIAGICLIHLRDVRPKGLPPVLGLSSENAAHRIAVTWDTPEGEREGVFIPRRDSSSRLNALVGGRFFPGTHHLAHFDVTEDGETLSVGFRSLDDTTCAQVAGRASDVFPSSSAFASLEEASGFFERGSVGYSPTRTSGLFEGLALCVDDWRVTPFQVSTSSSTFFDGSHELPRDAAELDCALLMRNVPHEWRGLEPLQPADRSRAA